MPSSPAPLAHRCAALGLDRLSRPSPRAFMPEKGTALDMIKCIAIRHCLTDQIPTFTCQTKCRLLHVRAGGDAAQHGGLPRADCHRNQCDPQNHHELEDE